MKAVWIAGVTLARAASAQAQTTIYKFVDESGRVTYSNKPMKGATVLELEPLTVMQSASAPVAAKTVASIEKADAAPARDVKPAVATGTPGSTPAAVAPPVQRRRGRDRRPTPQ